MDDLDRLFARLVHNVQAGFPELLARRFEVSQVFQQLVPYRSNRRELGVASNEDYELALLRLLAGERGYVVGDAALQEAMRVEVTSPNPDLTAYRRYATAAIALSSAAVAALDGAGEDEGPDREPVLPPDGGVAMDGGAAERARLAARATEPMATALPAAPISADPAPRPIPTHATSPATAPRLPSPALDAPMTASRSTPITAAAGDGCRYCAGPLPEGRRLTFCPHCGHNLTIRHCPACSTELEVQWKFCITCGRDMAT